MNLLSGVTSRLGTSYTTIREGVASKIDAAQEIVTEVTHAWQNSDDEELLISEAIIGGDDRGFKNAKQQQSREEDVDKLEKIKLEIASLERSDRPIVQTTEKTYFEPMIESLVPVYPLSTSDDRRSSIISKGLPSRTISLNSEDSGNIAIVASEVVDCEIPQEPSIEFEDSHLDDVLDSYRKDDHAAKMDKVKNINQALLEEAESMKLQLTEERIERQKLMSFLEEKEQTIQGLTNAQTGLKDELCDADKQIEYWKKAAAQFEDSERIIMQNHRQLMLNFYALQDEKGCNCNNDIQNIEDQRAKLQEENANLHSELEDVQSQLSLSAEMIDEQKSMFNQQRQSLTAQINHYKNLEEERTKVQSKNDELNLYLQKAELKESELSNQIMKLKEDLEKSTKKNTDLEKATIGLLDRVNKVMVQEDVLINIEELRHKIEEVLEKEELNSDVPLKPEIIWNLRTLIGDELQLRPWEKMRWLGIGKYPPTDSTKGSESGLGAQFLSFLESDTDR